MQLALGSCHYDVTARALVIGVLGLGLPPSPAGWRHLDACCRRAERLVADGVDALEVGGEAVGGAPASADEEDLDRVIPVIRALRARFDVPLVCDTGRVTVAREVLAAGAAVIRDGTGGVDRGSLSAVAEAGASVVVAPSSAEPPAPDGDGGWHRTLTDAAARAWAAGVPAERVLLDIGAQRSAGPDRGVLLRRSSALADLGCGLVLSEGCRPADPRGAGGSERAESIAAWALGVLSGCRVLRTADGRGARRTADVMAALLSTGGHP